MRQSHTYRNPWSDSYDNRTSDSRCDRIADADCHACAYCGPFSYPDTQANSHTYT